MLRKLVDWLIALGESTPYFHLLHADGSLYMGRYWLMPRCLLRWASEIDRDNHGQDYLKPLRWLPFSVRLHNIATPDYDRDFHDHPASFISIVLRGGYHERRPIGIEPEWERILVPVKSLSPEMMVNPSVTEAIQEKGRTQFRGPGSIALRMATDRHVITDVCRDTWTLVIWFRKVQWWGFYTTRGKVHWQDYDSVHNARSL